MGRVRLSDNLHVVTTPVVTRAHGALARSRL
jgi:hypothetical protein